MNFPKEPNFPRGADNFARGCPAPGAPSGYASGFASPLERTFPTSTGGFFDRGVTVGVT